MINLEDAKLLTHGTTIYSNRWTNADGTPERWRINGMVKRWKRDRDRIQIPIKRGLWEYDYLTNANLDEFELDEQAAQADIDEQNNPDPCHTCQRTDCKQADCYPEGRYPNYDR